MKPNPVQLNFWETASAGAEQLESRSFVWPTNETVSSALSFRDRLANLYLNGFFPSLVLCLLGFFIAGGTSSLETGFGALVLAPILAGFFLPFMRRCGIVSNWRLILLSLPLLLTCVLGTLIPSALQYRLEENFLHLEFFAVVLQQRLEQALSLGSLALFLSGVIVVALGAAFLRRRCPWYEPAKSSKSSTIWRLCVLGAVMLPAFFEVAGVAFISNKHVNVVTNSNPLKPSIEYVTLISEEHDKWVREKRSEFENRPYFQLPEKNDSDYWEKELEKFRNVMDSMDLDDSPELKLTQEQLQRIVSEIGLANLKEHEPRSKEELEHAGTYFLWHLADGAFPIPTPVMSRMKIHFFKRPTGDSIYTEDMLPKLLTALASLKADEAQLRAWLESSKELEELILTREQELDMEAARVLWGDGLFVAEQLGWYSPEEVYSWKPEKKMGWNYRAVTAPQDLKILGMTFSNSPTRWMHNYQMRRLIRAWVDLRQSLVTQDLDVQLRALAGMRDFNSPGTTEYQFWDALYRENNVSNERALLKTAELILSLRLFHKETGRWPRTLSELSFDFDSARFQWTTNGSEATLRDLRTEAEYRLALEKK